MANDPFPHLKALAEVPEANVAVFAFLLNYPWEFWQVPFFAGMAAAPHWEAVLICTRAAFGDAVIALIAYWIVAATVGSRGWVLRPGAVARIGYVAAGVAITILMERLATGPLGRWAYDSAMPIVPGLAVGLLPLLQWTVLPPLVLWLVRRHLT